MQLKGLVRLFLFQYYEIKTEIFIIFDGLCRFRFLCKIKLADSLDVIVEG